MAPRDYEAAQRFMRQQGFNPRTWSNVVMVAAALERGIEVYAKPERKSIFLRHGSVENRWQAGSSRLNSRLARRCLNRKDVLNRLLRDSGLPAPENCVFEAAEVDRAWAWAEPIAPVVVKPLDGRQGKDVHMGVRDASTLARVFQELSARHQNILVEDQILGDDHRVLAVDGEVVAITRRRPANVHGDGTATIGELVERKNAVRSIGHKKIALDGIARDFLASQGLTLDSVPAAGQEVQIRESANLATGGDAIDVTDEVAGRVRTLVAHAMEAIPGLRCAGLDVAIPQDAADGGMGIIEINGSPAIQGHHFPWAGTPRDAAGAVLDAMFPATRGAPVAAKTPRRDERISRAVI
ncbi:ATP-grasp domain-containing protein [Nesterenkonia suensis]